MTSDRELQVEMSGKAALDARMYGVDLLGDPMVPEPSGPVAEKFLFPPFSILDAHAGDWQDRKRAWASMGIQGEVGRDSSVIHCPNSSSAQAMPDARYVSIFDPTLCECVYRWFSPEGAQIVDPFAGGSVRGIVAGSLDRKYWGCDLRREQIEANETQADAIMGATVPVMDNDAAKGSDRKPSTRPVWVTGDAMTVLDSAPDADLIFSCPPYGDLEKYSDDPADLSNMEWHTFVAAYKRIILRSIKRLRNDRFACFVVGDFRDKQGYYRDFVSTTIAAFCDAGARLYNEAILASAIGSAPMRVSKQFHSGRKFAKRHQNVLVFCKGDWRKAAAYCNGKPDKAT